MSIGNLVGHYASQNAIEDITPQTMPIPGREADMSPNSSGGFSFNLSRWDRLDRFLILGSDSGSYYASERELTVENAKVVVSCITEDPSQVVRRVVQISQSGRAPKNKQAIFVLALVARLAKSAAARSEAYAALPKVCRIGTHLFQWIKAYKGLKSQGGLPTGAQKAIVRWYMQMPEDRLALQVAKYKQREGWSHRDVFRLVKPGASKHGVTKSGAQDAILDWVTQGTTPERVGDARDFLWAVDEAQEIGKRGGSSKEILPLIEEFGLPRECIPTEYLNSTDVWETLLDNRGCGMPMTAMIRNLGKMTSLGLVSSSSDAARKICTQLGSVEALKRARIHPLQLLVALNTYKLGRGIRGSLSWSPVSSVLDSLDKAFYTSFQAIEPTGKRHFLALDVSGSMSINEISGLPGITPRIGSAAMALITAATEEDSLFRGFSRNMIPLDISPRRRLDDNLRSISNLPFGGTDCSLPMEYAIQHKIPVDTFVVYTDSETYAGRRQPVQSLQDYRQRMGIPAKLIVVGMTSNGFTIADPQDGGMLDVVGFDSAAPRIMADFTRG